MKTPIIRPTKLLILYKKKERKKERKKEKTATFCVNWLMDKLYLISDVFENFLFFRIFVFCNNFFYTQVAFVFLSNLVHYLFILFTAIFMLFVFFLFKCDFDTFYNFFNLFLCLFFLIISSWRIFRYFYLFEKKNMKINCKRNYMKVDAKMF